MVVQALALGGLTKAMEGLTNQLKSTMDFAMKADKASAALGMTFEQTNDQLGGTMEGLRGDLNQRFAGAIAGMEAGLQGNTAGVAHLVNQQRLTGTQSAKTAKTFAKMEATLGNSRDSTNKLAGLLPELGATWQVSTDLLVGAIDTLAKSFPAQKLAGMGAEVTQAFTTLTAELGPSMKGPMDSVMGMIMDTSMKGYENLTKLGIGNVREQLASAKTAAEAQSIIKDAIQKASGTFKDVVGDASQGFFQVGVASEIFGESAIQLTAVNDAFGTRVKQEGADAEAFGNQLGVIKDEIMLPLQTALIEFFPIIKGVGEIIGTYLKDGVQEVVNRLSEMFVNIGGFSGMIESLKKKFGEWKIKIIDITKIMKNVLAIAFVALAAKVMFLTVAAIIPLVIGFGSLLLAIVAALVPFWPFIAAIGAIVLIVKLLNDKFGFMDPVIASVTDAFKWLKEGLGDFLIGLGDMWGVPDAIADWGHALKGSTSELKKKVSKEKKTDEEIAASLKETLKNDKKALGLTEDIKDATKETARNTTIDIKTNPEFLDQTANMLGRSIESILGITKDNSAAEIVEELRALNQQTAVLVEKPDPEGAPATAS